MNELGLLVHITEDILKDHLFKRGLNVRLLLSMSPAA